MILNRELKEVVEAAITRRFAVTLGDNLTLVSVLGDQWMMYLDARDKSLTPHLAAKGIYHPHILEAICRYVTPGMTCVDVGAGFGYHTLLLCELVGAHGRVYALEPHPRIFPVLKRNLELNQFTRIARPYPNAAGAQEGTGELAIHRWNYDSATLADRAKASFNSANKELVKVSRLDDLLLEYQPEPDFFLISTVAYEPQVWAGMKGLLHAKRKVSVLLEALPRWYAQAEEFFNDLLDEGFIVHRVHEHGDLELLNSVNDFCSQFRSWVLLTR